MRSLPRLLAVTVLPTLLFAAPIAASAALVRVKIVTVFSDDPNAPQSFRVGAIKVNIDDVAATTGDDTDDLRCLGGPNFRHACSASSACPGSTCGNPGDNDGDGHDEEELGIARTKVVPGPHVVGIDTAELRDENGAKYRVGSIRIEETVTALGKLCKPESKPEGDVSYQFDEDVDHSSASDYTVAIRIVPLAAPAFTGGEQCGGEGNSTKALNKCKRTVVKASADYFETLVDVSTDCELERTAGKSDCSAPVFQERIFKAGVAFAKAVGKACGGKDKTCGGTSENEFTPAQIGFAAECPTLHGSCGGSIGDCAGIVSCLECIDQFGVAELLLLGRNIGAPPVAEKPLRKCKEKVLREISRYSRGESKLFSECNEDLVKDSQAKCRDTISGSFDKLVSKLDKSVCSACGGKEQKGCGGPDDFTPGQIGFDANCPATGACGTFPVTNLQELTFCHVCVSSAIDGCVLSAAFPSGGEYPEVCQ